MWHSFTFFLLPIIFFVCVCVLLHSIFAFLFDPKAICNLFSVCQRFFPIWYIFLSHSFSVYFSHQCQHIQVVRRCVLKLFMNSKWLLFTPSLCFFFSSPSHDTQLGALHIHSIWNVNISMTLLKMKLFL